MWYSRTLKQLNPGDRVGVNVPGAGYVGAGCVTGNMQSALDFNVSTPDAERPVVDAAKRGTYHAEFRNDPEQCEYFGRFVAGKRFR